MNFNNLNIIILLGAIQGFTLCIYLFTKRKENKLVFNFYALFLFSLAFFNFIYALKYMGVNQIGRIPLESFPFPYKYLIGVGFYFYVKSHFNLSGKKLITFREYCLFAPALIYGFIRLYWYYNLHTGINRDIFRNVYNTGFFVYNEFVYLSFNLLLALFALNYLNKRKLEIEASKRNRDNWKWLRWFSLIFAGITVLNLMHQIASLVFNLQYSRPFYYVILVLNSLYIYWIGLDGFIRSNTLFKTIRLRKETENHNDLRCQFEYFINKEEIFTNSTLKITDVASRLNLSSKEFSIFMLETYKVTFSEFINTRRIERVKFLLTSSDIDKYTLIAIAEKAGFNSKSSFNAIFKKETGLTPREYRLRNNT